MIIAQHGVSTSSSWSTISTPVSRQRTDGLILREQWIAHDGLFDRLAARFDFAIFTGPHTMEAQVTLTRFAPLCASIRSLARKMSTARKPASGRPAEDCAHEPAERKWYIGDTVDDARCARAAKCRSSASPRRRVHGATSWSLCSKPKAPSPYSTTSINWRLC